MTNGYVQNIEGWKVVNEFMKNEILKNWRVVVDKDFTEINNGNSIQFHNQDESRIIYLSVLAVTPENDESFELPKKFEHQPEIIKEGRWYHLRGTKIHGNQVLIVVITFKNKNDELWANDFFNAYIGPADVV